VVVRAEGKAAAITAVVRAMAVAAARAKARWVVARENGRGGWWRPRGQPPQAPAPAVMQREQPAYAASSAAADALRARMAAFARGGSV